ncbi:MAG: hypothetical protein AUJ98_09085 [Bacteroidetes bacterium CG2_30_33_31]|nr:MAG: hypothetical protein AUJ98_09085 [Bacteroidetes bacterium CG2_30_33_31]
MYPGNSPYMHCMGNPIMLIDPDGRWVKGAGFWRNIFKTDHRIKAENIERKHTGATKTRTETGWRVSWEEGEQYVNEDGTYTKLKTWAFVDIDKKKKSKGELFFKVGGSVSLGLQLGGGVTVNKTRIAVSGNIASVTLLKEDATQTGSDSQPWEKSGSYIGKDGKMEISQGISLIAGYKHSFETTGHGHVSGTEKHQYNLGPLVMDNTGKTSVKIGLEGAVIFGVSINVEFGIKH